MTAIRLTLLSIITIGLIYFPVILGFAKILAPETSIGSIINGPDGKPVGSRHIAQAFEAPRYFHPRPSACAYDASAAAGSNFSPANPAIADRALEIIAREGGNEKSPIPADLVTASGSGLDPDISLAGARYQIERVASARGLRVQEIDNLISQNARPLLGNFGEDVIVNVLELNLALDKLSLKK